MQLAEVNAALITGAGSGMGRKTAEFLAQQGVKVVCADIQAEAVKTLANDLDGLPMVVDVTDPELFERELLAAVDQVGEIRAVVNCAGVLAAGRVIGKHGPMPLQNFSDVIHVNLVGTFNVMRLVAAHMSSLPAVTSDDERGVIINTSSVAATDGQLGQVAYSAAKAGVAAMTLPAARELARFGVRVMAIAPGIVATPMIDSLSSEAQSELARQTCFPKRLGQPKEFAELVGHIIENSYLNASVIRLDGGIRMQ